MCRAKINKIYLVSAVSILLVFFFICLLGTAETDPGHREIDRLLMQHLKKEEPLPTGFSATSDRADTVIYVMSGAEKSLERRFRIAAELYHRGLAHRILTLSKPGITAFDHQLGRNLTNDEWSFMRLSEYGIPVQDIEFINLKKGIFGTWTEAQGMCGIATQRDYKHVILVTSPYHTLRTWLSFSKIAKSQNLVIALYASDDRAALYSLLVEYVKLILYRNCVLTRTSSNNIHSAKYRTL